MCKLIPGLLLDLLSQAYQAGFVDGRGVIPPGLKALSHKRSVQLMTVFQGRVYRPCELEVVRKGVKGGDSSSHS